MQAAGSWKSMAFIPIGITQFIPVYYALDYKAVQDIHDAALILMFVTHRGLATS